MLGVHKYYTSHLTLEGSFSAVSKSMFAFRSSFDIYRFEHVCAFGIQSENQDFCTFAPLESNRKTMKSASGKRPPDKTHSAPEKKLSSRISSA